MPDIADALALAAQQLDEAVAGLGTDSDAPDGVEGTLSACLTTLQSVRGEAERAAEGSLDLVRLEARASENMDLAILALERLETATDGSRAALQTALFHTRRALDYFHRFLEDLTERTRAIDRERNRQEFLSG